MKYKNKTFRTHKPVSEREMLRVKHIGENSICQTIRTTYVLIDNMDLNREYIKRYLRLIMAMAKSMNTRLLEYREASKLMEGRDQ